MKTLERRSFLSVISSAIAGTALSPLLKLSLVRGVQSQDYKNPRAAESCWLDVCAPLVIQDKTLGIDSEIVLTADNFIGARGYDDGLDSTEYEICLYGPDGRPLGQDGVTKRLTVPAMHTTVVPVSSLLGSGDRFWGGMKIRLRPRTRTPMHAGDLFSSAFVRWKSGASFTNVHANPDPLEWQRADAFFYSMPFPPLHEYHCVYSLFNPYSEPSVGTITLYDSFGVKLNEVRYEVKSYSSVILDLATAEYANDIRELFNPKHQGRRKVGGERGGTIAVTNAQGTVKNFGYLFIKQASGGRFSVEHPIHQPPFNPLPATTAFDAAGRLKARNILYTPLVFNSRRLGGLTFQSRFHLSSGAPMEEFLRISPFITSSRGDVVWQMGGESEPPTTIPKQQIERGVIKLGGQQSCILDCSELGLPGDFAGSLSLPITPNSNHTLMKVEVRITEWDAPAFTHFRPGLASARNYQKPLHRGGLGTDYIVSTGRFQLAFGKVVRDELIAVINIDDKNIAGNPVLEIFAPTGLVARVKLGQIPAFGCGHYLLSELLSQKIPPSDLTMRLVDEQTTLLMSVLHLDYDRRAIAADHGSDRFSTFNEFTCERRA